MRVAPVFRDRMVLQRQQPIRIWGTAPGGREIAARLGSLTSGNAVAGDDGTWALTLEAQEAARGLTLTVSDEQRTAEFHDVAIGEVWLAGGQSNMEFNLEFDADREAVFHGPMNPDIRFFDVPKVSYAGQEDEHDYGLFGVWRRCTPEDLRYFSAVGYYFGEHLQSALDVPVGIVGCNWGGTPACTWTSRTSLQQGAGAVWVEEYEQGLTQFNPDQEAELFRVHKMSDRTDPFGNPLLYRAMRDSLTEDEQHELIASFADNVLPTTGLLHPNRPGGLFETMVRQIAPYGCRGVIWYQGEADIRHAELHAPVLTSVINSWRELWEQSDLPFLITQLAPFGTTPFGTGDIFPVIRCQQAEVARTVDQVWMASTSDLGAEHDIHPKNKKPVGIRLGLLAQSHVYNHDVAADAPAFDSAKRTDTGLEIRFLNAIELDWDGHPLPLEILSPQGEHIPVDECTTCNNVLLLKASVPSGAEIKFAWRDYYYVDLRNEAGIPVLPFREQVY